MRQDRPVPARDADATAGVARETRNEVPMKYMLLIHQGSTPTPYDPAAWARLSPDEQNDSYVILVHRYNAKTFLC